VRAALRKLVRALPEGFRPQAEAASTALVVDSQTWDESSRQWPAPPHLDALQAAVIDGVQVDVAYVARDGAATMRRVHPLGLACKGSTWYLVAGTDAGQRTFRVDRVGEVTTTDEPVVRPDGFDLATAWGEITDSVDELRLPLRVRALVEGDLVVLLRQMFGRRVRIGPAIDDGRVEVEVRGHHVHSLAGELAGLGARVEVLDPPDVRARLREIGTELAAAYA
jgi:predicted DNA-binding transcriptional regulator YafY